MIFLMIPKKNALPPVFGLTLDLNALYSGFSDINGHLHDTMSKRMCCMAYALVQPGRVCTPSLKKGYNQKKACSSNCMIYFP